MLSDPPRGGWRSRAPPPSPERMAWPRVVTPWLSACPRRMRRAQAGAPEDGGGSAGGDAPPETAALPAAWLARRLPAARRSGLAAAEPAAIATPDAPPLR